MTDGPAPIAGRRILIVEDEYLIAEEMIMEFEAIGATIVGPVANNEDALSLIECDDAIDGAILDINLHGSMVYPVADRLMQRGVPFVFATGYDRCSVHPEYRDVTVCEKPVGPLAVGNALFGWRTRHQRPIGEAS